LDHLAQVLADPMVMGPLRKSPFPAEKSRETFDYILQHCERHGYGPWATFEKAWGRYVGQ
jgi:hypothetical protein